MFNGYTTVFVLVWVGVLTEALTNRVSTDPFLLLEVIRAAVEPLQGFLNCLVYVHVFLYRIHTWQKIGTLGARAVHGHTAQLNPSEILNE